MIHLPVSSTNSFSFLRRIRPKSSPLPFVPTSPLPSSSVPSLSSSPFHSSASFASSSSSSVSPVPSSFPSPHPSSAVSTRTFATSVFAGRPLPKALFSVPFLREPADFLKAAQNAVKVCNPLIASITQPGGDPNHSTPKITSPVSGLRTLRKLDTISDTICKVLDAAECTRNIAGTSEWRNAAEEAFHGLSSYMYQLNAFRPLYEALCQITDDEVTMKALNEEQKRMAILLRREFERDGIHLPLVSREKVVQLNSDIGQLTSKYLSNMKEIEYLPIGLSGAGIEEAVHQLPLHIQSLFPSSSSFRSVPVDTVAADKETYEHSPSIAAGALEAGGVSIAASIGNTTGSTTKTTDDKTSLLSNSNTPTNNNHNRSIIFPTDPGIVGEILRLITHEYVRAKLMMTVHAAHTSNVSVLEDIRIQRSILARQIGFPSYAHMMASDRMAGDPKNAILFLQRLAHAVMPRAALDFYSLATAKINDTVDTQKTQDNTKMEEVLVSTTAAERTTHKTIESILSSNALDIPITRSLYQAISSTTGTYVRPWDIPYYSSHIIAEKYHIDINMAAKYFPLSAVLDGLQGIMARVFGVTMVRLPVDGTESWITNTSSGYDKTTDGGKKDNDSGGGGFFGWTNNSSTNKASSAHQPLLLKYVLRHDVEGALGTMYLDLFSRPGKFGGAAHFVIRCGKRLHESDGAFEETMGVPPPPVSGTIGPTVQLPIIVLATNYAPPSSNAHAAANVETDASAVDDPLSHVLMTPQEVETLFHEFGHALHSLLSRTEFQHLSGTRGALDFVEVPSHVMEYFARDFRVIRTFARHHITSEPMPEGLWTRIQSARSAFAGLDLQQAICTALYDQALFGSPETLRMILEDFPKMTTGMVTETNVKNLAQSLKEYVDDPKTNNNSSSLPIPTLSSLSTEEMIIPLAAEHTLRPMPSTNEIVQQEEKTSHGTATKPLVDSTTLLSAIHERYNISPHLHTSKWHATFAHAATYGGGYYTYVYAAAISSALWQKLFQKEPFSRTAGELYRREVLSKGASMDPVTILHRILEGPPTMEPLLKELGLRVPEPTKKE